MRRLDGSSLTDYEAKRRLRWSQARRIPWDSEAEADALRYLFRRNLWAFFLYAFGAARNPKGKRWIEDDVHRPLADWFQRHADEWLAQRRHPGAPRQQKHLAVLVHREVGKTTMISQAAQLWLHLRDPELSSYSGAESLRLAASILHSIKAVMDGSDPYALFMPLYGSWFGASRTWTGDTVTHAARRNVARKDPSFGTFAVETSILGAHPDAIFYDDPISYERLKSDTHWLEAVNSQVTSLYPVIQADGLVVWVGTRYDDADHFGVAFEQEGIASIEGIASDSLRVTEGGLWHVYFLAGRDGNGQPTTAKVWPEERLLNYQRRDPLRYAAQVMNDPAISELNPITREQLQQCVVPQDRVPWNALRFAITTDTAFWDGFRRSASQKDETVFLIWGYPRDGSGDVYFVEGYGSTLWRAEDFARQLVTAVQRYRRQGRRIFAITDELTVAGKKGAWKLSLQNFFNDVNEPMPVLHELSRGPQHKQGRLVSAASFWVDGHVRVVDRAPGAERLLQQMARIGQYSVNPRIRIDWADAAADAFSPALYQPMRRTGPGVAPWAAGATPIATEGLEMGEFDDEALALKGYFDDAPRPPLR